MKKFVLAIAAMFAMSFAACTGNGTNTADENDSTAVDSVVVDSIAADSVMTDSVIADSIVVK